jgi:hypothetical protein
MNNLTNFVNTAGEGHGDPPLTSVISAVTATPYTHVDDVVKYNGVVTTSMMVNGCVDSDPKRTSYEVGVTRGATERFERADPTDRKLDTKMRTSEEIQEFVRQMCRRECALPSEWGFMNLFGVVVRLAQGCSHFAAWGQLTSTQLRGGLQASVSALAAVNQPVAANNGAVYVSCRVVSHERPNVLAALLNAISGEGGTMVTDLLIIDGNNIPQLPDAGGLALAQGCHAANRILGAHFKACGKGALFAYAMTLGTHRAKDLVPHLEEGEFIKSVFRTGEFTVPFGAIVCDLEPDTCMPEPAGSISGFRATYDSILIATGGLVAASDPMVKIKDKFYPTILGSANGNPGHAGTSQAGGGQDSAQLTEQWANAAGGFAKHFIRNLETLFNTAGGITEVTNLITAQANMNAGTDAECMRKKVAVAFYLVEPTTACPVYDDTLPAVRARFGPLATSGRMTELPGFDGGVFVKQVSDSNNSTFQVDFRMARRHGTLLHLMKHARGGDERVVINSAGPDDFSLLGGTNDPAATRIGRADNLSQYSWGDNGPCGLSAPGEIMYTGSSVLLTLNHVVNAGGRLVMTATPNSMEALMGDTTVSASRLAGGDPGAAIDYTTYFDNIRRSRNQSSDILAMAIDQARTPVVRNRWVVTQRISDAGELPTGGANPAVPASGNEEERNNVRQPDNPIVPAADQNNSGPLEPAGNRANGPARGVVIENRRTDGPRRPATRGARPAGGGSAGGNAGGNTNLVPGIGPGGQGLQRGPPQPSGPGTPANLPGGGGGLAQEVVDASPESNASGGVSVDLNGTI